MRPAVTPAMLRFRAQAYLRALRVLGGRHIVLPLMATPVWIVPFVSLGRKPSSGARPLDPGWVVMLALLQMAPYFEIQLAPSLAFVRAWPVPFPTRWLTLGPLVGLGAIVTVALAAVAHLSALAAVTALGYGWWAIAVARWGTWRACAPAGSRSGVARNVVAGLAHLPLVALAPIASRAALHAGGRAAAAASAIALGLVGLALQPEMRPGALGGLRSLARGAGAPRSGPAVASAPRPRRAQVRTGWFATAVRASWVDRSLVPAMMAAIFPVTALLMPAEGAPAMAGALAVSIWLLGSMMAKDASRAREDFFVVRPLTAAQWWLGRGLTLLVMLSWPAILCVRSGIPAEAALQAAILVVAMLFSGAAVQTTKQPRDRWLVGLFAIGVLMTGSIPSIDGWWHPPLWLLAAEALVAVALWARLWRRAR